MVGVLTLKQKTIIKENLSQCMVMYYKSKKKIYRSTRTYMNKLIKWLKQARTKLDNVLTQCKLGRQRKKYQEELVDVDYPVVKRMKRKESAAMQTARMYAELLDIVDRVDGDKLCIKRKNLSAYEKVIGEYL